MASTRTARLKGSDILGSCSGSWRDLTFRETELARDEVFNQRLGQSSVDRGDICGKRGRLRDAFCLCSINITSERGRQILARPRIKRRGIGGVPAVEGLP